MEERYLNKVLASLFLVILLVISFFLVRSFLMSILLGLILSLIFLPIYNWILSKTNSKTLSGLILCFSLFFLFLIPLFFLLPILLQESLNIYFTLQNTDFISTLSDFFPSIFSNEQFLLQTSRAIDSSIDLIASYFLNMTTNLIVNFPQLLVQISIIFFVLFFALKDSKLLMEYLEDMLPFEREIKRKIFRQSKEITLSVLWGQVIMGIIQGLIVGIGFWIFGLQSAFLLTLLATLAGILPIIGTTVVWVPTTITLFFMGHPFSAIGILIFGLTSTFVENFIRPIIVSKGTSLHPALILIGMVGGLLSYGFVGLILGPIILAYLFIVLETFRSKKRGIFITVEQ